MRRQTESGLVAVHGNIKMMARPFGEGTNGVDVGERFADQRAEQYSRRLGPSSGGGAPPFGAWVCAAAGRPSASCVQ